LVDDPDAAVARFVDFALLAADLRLDRVSMPARIRRVVVSHGVVYES
jgi:hypothetical protein